MLSDDEDEMPKNEKPATQSKATTAKKRSSGMLYPAAVHTTTVPAKEGLTGIFYIDSGASIRSSKGDLRAHIRIRAAR